MWSWITELMAESATLRLFMVVGIGYVIGEIRFPGNFRLGLAAVLFAGMSFGALAPAYVLPHEVQTIGLVLFVYCVGLEAGPGFLSSFKSHGVRLNFSASVAILAAFFLVWVAIQFSGRSREVLAGLFCGALTNTPALGATTESILRSTGNANAANAAVVGYGVAYPFAVLATLLLFQFRVMFQKSPQPEGSSTVTLPRAQTVEVKELHGSLPWVVELLEEETGVIVTRVKRPEGQLLLATRNMALQSGDLVVVVGTPMQLQKCVDLLGVIASVQVESDMSGFEVHRYFVSNSEIVGRPLRELGLEKLGGVISRLRRADVDLPVTDKTVLQLGDRVRVVSYKENEVAIRKFFGNSLTTLSETGYFSFAVGITLGLALGAVPIPVPGIEKPITLGAAGGPLLMALMLGHLGRTGPFVWTPPLTASMTLKHVGILFFLACAGVKAGSVLPQTLKADGWFLVGLTVVVTLAAHLVLWMLLRWKPDAGLQTALGASSGMQTQPAALAFAAQRFPGSMVNLPYATVYPLAIILKIVLAQALLVI